MLVPSGNRSHACAIGPQKGALGGPFDVDKPVDQRVFIKLEDPARRTRLVHKRIDGERCLLGRTPFPEIGKSEQEDAVGQAGLGAVPKSA